MVLYTSYRREDEGEFLRGLACVALAAAINAEGEGDQDKPAMPAPRRRPGPQPGPARPSPYFLADEAAAYLRLSLDALYSLVQRGKLTPLPGHRHYRFTEKELTRFLENNR